MTTEKQIEAALSAAFKKVLGFDPKHEEAKGSMWNPLGGRLTKPLTVPSAKKGIERAEVVADYEIGMGRAAIARRHGITYNAVTYHLKQAGKI